MKRGMCVWRAAVVPAVLLAGIMGCSRHPVASNAGRFAAVPPVIDGLATDWTDSLRYDPGSKLQYQVLNDGRHVYLRLKAADLATQARILRLGLTVWLDTTGRNQHQFGVHYPLGNQPGTGAPTRPDGPAAGSAAGPNDRRESMAQAIGQMREMELLHYKGSAEPTLTDTQSQLGVKAAMSLDAQESLVYELAVPLRLLYRTLRTLTGRPAVVGFTLAGGKLVMPAQGGSMQGPGMRGGGMGGMRGGHGGGGGMRGGGMRGGYGGGQQASAISLKTSLQISSR
ncbi:hypothetical protein MUN81_08660 [Hymenobacter sp. 5317J-9]|uniref:hypothetical protein n=1 Tax=Hymenobacter sp. 5317J-9 TaxID=2932250 RepID=UPI001FD6F84F|nr:hypothetical protein [Hymenobacter sp. 5317J-9]UOQ99548.1 hypothetical protein MUN81_08660 [Hymenobacter sp. 5317J-9]